MANDQINQYPITAVTIEDESFFDIDQWTGAAFESQKVPATLMASVFGVNIGNSDLQCTDPIRKLLLQGTDPDGVRFSVRNSADTIDFFKVAGGGIITFNEAFSFPLVDGAVGEVLTTNGSGAVSWAAGGGADTNIGTNDLTISATGTRQLQMFGGLTTDAFNLRNSLDTDNLFSFSGDGTFTIGLGANNSGGSSLYNVVIGGSATNNGLSNTTIIGHQAFSTAFGGTAIGKDAQALGSYGTSVGNLTKSGLNSVAIGSLANASVGQYNISIGEGSSCTGFYGIAMGRYAVAPTDCVVIGSTATAGNVYCTVMGKGAYGSHYSTAYGTNAKANNQMALAIGASADVTGWSSGLISMSAAARTNTVHQTLAVNFGLTDHTWRIGHTADQWNIGTGSFGYGTMTPDASAIVQMDSTTKGFLPPVMRTGEKNAIASPATGLIVFDTDLGKLCVYTGAAWETVTSV